MNNLDNIKKDVSLVLSGGGARGFAHIGVIEELEKTEYNILSVTGTSMGALVGAVYTMGKLKEFKEWVYSLDKRDMLSMIDFTLGSKGFIRGEKVLEKMKEFIPDRNIEDLSIKYIATATDITNRKEVVFKKGSIYKAIRASIAIPSVFTPVEDNGRILIDGGVLNNLPIDLANIQNGEKLVVVNVNANIPFEKRKIVKKEEQEKLNLYQRKVRNIQRFLFKKASLEQKEKLGHYQLLNQTISLMMHKIDLMSLKEHQPDILINVPRDLCRTFDFHRAEEIVEAGRNAAINTLAKKIQVV